jgi:hypothetical protein
MLLGLSVDVVAKRVVRKRIHGVVTKKIHSKSVCKLGPSTDVWLYIRCKNVAKEKTKNDIPCIILVEVPKNSLRCDAKNCPSSDTKVVGNAFMGKDHSYFVGMRVGVLKKGTLNNPRNYMKKKPQKNIKLDNIYFLQVKKGNYDALHTRGRQR